MIKKLTTAPCAKCKKNVEYFIVEGFNNNLNLSNYSHFKKPIINICPSCGYINDDLSVDNILYQIRPLNLIEGEDLIIDAMNNIKIARNYLSNVLEIEKKLRLLANIFENNKLVLNLFLKDNYTKEDAETKKILKELQTNLKNSAETIFSFITENKNSDNFSKLLQIEVLSCLNKTEEAKKILKTFTNLSPDLQDYLEDCIDMGGLC